MPSGGKTGDRCCVAKNQTDVVTRLVTGGVESMAAGASPVGIAVAKDDLPLADAVAQAVNKLIKDGSYEKILDAWGTGAGCIDKAEVNPQLNK